VVAVWAEVLVGVVGCGQGGVVPAWMAPAGDVGVLEWWFVNFLLFVLFLLCVEIYEVRVRCLEVGGVGPLFPSA
jgi:hypothetical protein